MNQDGINCYIQDIEDCIDNILEQYKDKDLTDEEKNNIIYHKRKLKSATDALDDMIDDVRLETEENAEDRISVIRGDLEDYRTFLGIDGVNSAIAKEIVEFIDDTCWNW